MPPKPWETAAANKDTLNSADIASGTPFTSTNSTSLNNPSDLGGLGSQLNNTDSLGLNNSAGYGSGYGSGSAFGSYGSGYGSSYGSGYGGYGSSLGGYGSSLGGYGSYGSGYGGYGSYGSGYGGGYGMGRGMFGMNRPGQQGNFMEFALRYLDSFSYGVSSLCEMTRNIEMNAEGLSRFWASMRNILVRFFGWFAKLFKGAKDILMRAIDLIKTKLFSKAFLSGLIFSGHASSAKAYNILFRFCMITLALTLIAPLIKIKRV